MPSIIMVKIITSVIHINSLLKAITFFAKYLVKVESYNILKIISVHDTNYDF